MNTMTRRLVRRAGLCLLLVGGAVSAAAASDSTCVRLLGSPGAYVELSRGSLVSGTLPFALCDVEPGEGYRLIVGGAGFEERVGSFALEASGMPVVRGRRFSSALLNAVLPGMGSRHAGRWEMGLSDDLAIAASLVALEQEELGYRHLRNRLEVLETDFAAATTYAEASRLRDAALEASREVNVQNAHRRRLAAVAGALYAWQVIDPILTAAPPSWRANAAVREITLEGAGQSRAKAFVYSLVRPGRGQFYQGKIVRGAILSSAVLAAGLVALEFQNRYDFAVDDYELCVERFDATDVVSEKERLRAEAAGLWSAVEDEKEQRNISLIVLAGLWGYNLVDTMFPADGGGADPRFSFDVDSRGASVALRF